MDAEEYENAFPIPGDAFGGQQAGLSKLEYVAAAVASGLASRANIEISDVAEVSVLVAKQIFANLKEPKASLPEILECEACHQKKPDVQKRNCPFQEDVNAKIVAVQTCDTCNRDSIMEI